MPNGDILHKENYSCKKFNLRPRKCRDYERRKKEIHNKAKQEHQKKVEKVEKTLDDKYYEMKTFF